MRARRIDEANLREANAGLCRELAEVKSERDVALGLLPGKLRGERALNEEKCRCFLMRAESAEAERDRLRAALRHALEWLDDQGCDCGTDEPGTCALCEANAALAGKVQP